MSFNFPTTVRGWREGSHHLEICDDTHHRANYGENEQAIIHPSSENGLRLWYFVLFH